MFMKQLLTIILGFSLVGMPAVSRAENASLFQACGQVLETSVLATTAGIGGGVAGCLLGIWTANGISAMCGFNKKERQVNMLVAGVAGLCLCPLPAAANVFYKSWTGATLHPVDQALCVLGTLALGAQILEVINRKAQKDVPKDLIEKRAKKMVIKSEM